jgi:hypothetical protein
MDETAFVKVLGNSPIIRLLDFLIMERGLWDYSIRELSQNTGISWQTVDKLIEGFLKTGIVKNTRKVATADMYMLNEENTFSQILIGLDNMLSKAQVEGKNIKVEMVSSEDAMALVMNGKEDARETMKELCEC